MSSQFLVMKTRICDVFVYILSIPYFNFIWGWQTLDTVYLCLKTYQQVLVLMASCFLVIWTSFCLMFYYLWNLELQSVACILRINKMISKGNNHVFVKIVFFRFCNLQCYCNACLIIILNLSVGRKIKNKLKNSKFLAYKQSSCLVFVYTGKCSFSSWFFYTFSYLKNFFRLLCF